MRRIIVLFFVLVCMKPVAARMPEKALTDWLRPAVFSITMVMVHDVVNPPAASRYYAYIMLGAYDIVAQHNSSLTR
jgi:hypothetical protein